MEGEKKPLSFGFSKTKDAGKKLTSTVVGEDHKEKKQEVDYILSLDDKTIKSAKPVEEEKDLVIPLITANKWRLARTPAELEKDEVNGSTDSIKEEVVLPKAVSLSGDSATDQAVKEILKDAATDKSLIGSDYTIAVPLLMRNKIPDGFETDDRLDVTLRPDEACAADYDAIPIEQYGLAMLRGMGWKEGVGIGKTSQVVKPMDAAVRPKGLGLGADKSVLEQKKKCNGGDAGKVRREEEEEEGLEMKKGVHCVITSGRREGQYATITSMDEDNSRVMITMGIGGDVVTISQSCIRLVTKREYDKCYKYLNKAKVDSYNTAEQRKKDHRNSDNDRDKRTEMHRDRGSNRETDTHRDRKTDRGINGHSGRHADSERDKHATSWTENDTSERRKKRRAENDEDNDYKDDHQDGTRDRSAYSDHHKKSRPKHEVTNGGASSAKQSSSSWLFPNLRVRIIDESYRGGKYFKEKVTIEDVAGEDCCICKTSEGKVLEGVRQCQLETVVPRSTPSFVRIVIGKHRTQLGEILSRDKSRCTALVQLLTDRDVIIPVQYEHMCEYVGDIDTTFDY